MNLKQPMTIRLLTIIVGIVIGIWLIIPSRNVSGNPMFETMIQKSKNSAGNLFRLYSGDGGPTVGPWETVTYDPGLFGREKQIFSNYIEPEIRSIRCEENGLILEGPKITILLPYCDMAKLTRDPIIYYEGKISKASQSPIRHILLFIGIGVLLVSAFEAFRYVRVRRNWWARLSR